MSIQENKKRRGRPRKVKVQIEIQERCPKCGKLLFIASGDYFIRYKCPRCGFTSNVKSKEI